MYFCEAMDDHNLGQKHNEKVKVKEILEDS